MTYEQVMQWAPLGEWFAVAGIFYFLVWLTRTDMITDRMEKESATWRALDKAALYVPLPIGIALGAVLPVPAAMADFMNPYVFWASTWVGAIWKYKQQQSSAPAKE